MIIPTKGYEGTLQRVEELRSRLNLVREKKSEPQPSAAPTPMAGMIGSSSMAPVDPFAVGRITVSGAPTAMKDMIAQAAAQTGVDPSLLESLVQAESDFNPKSVSSKGAMGLTQLMPGTARSLGVTDPMDPMQNLVGGGKYLAQMLKQFGGDERLALAAYNAGPGAVKRYGGIPPFNETQHYVERIMTRVKSLRGSP